MSLPPFWLFSCALEVWVVCILPASAKRRQTQLLLAERSIAMMKPPRSRGGSFTFALRPYDNRAEKPPRLRGGSFTFALRPYDTRAEKPPRLRGGSFTALRPYDTRAEKPPRLRGGSFTALRPFRTCCPK
jgi:hypothetical protein